MSEDKKYVEHCKGVNGLDKVILREVRGHSAEVCLSLSFSPTNDTHFLIFVSLINIA